LDLLTLFSPPTDRTLEEIDEMFLNVSHHPASSHSSRRIKHETDDPQRVPVRKFKSYVTTGQAAGLDVRDIVKDTVTVTEVEKLESA
jgi:hypothetical protein